MLATRTFQREFGAMENANTAYVNAPPAWRAFPRKDERLCSRLSPEDFLTFDGPTGVAVSPDSPRADFFIHMGLHERTYRHRVLYRKMKAEAKAGMERLFQSRKSLRSELFHIEHVHPLFNLVQTTALEVAFQQEVDRIYATASRSTKGIYDIVGGPSCNWVIRWMLWRVIQTRLADEARASTSGTDTDTSIPAYSPPMEYSLPTPQSLKTSPNQSSSRYSAYDYSDSEDWDDTETTKVRIKPDPGAGNLQRSQHFHRRSYWENVL